MLLLQALQKRDIWKILYSDKEKWTSTTNVTILFRWSRLTASSPVFISFTSIPEHRCLKMLRCRKKKQTWKVLNLCRDIPMAYILTVWWTVSVLSELDVESSASEAKAGGCQVVWFEKMITFYNQAMESRSVTWKNKTRPFAFEFHRQLHQCGKNSSWWIKSFILCPLF